MKIILVGNPNCGKTTLYNKLTGEKGSVGNYSGITVSKRESKLKEEYGKNNITLVDLPGLYSLTPYTSEENITKDYILNESPDLIINVVDGANIERSLFFTTQLIELNIPMIVCINKLDVIKKRNEILDITKMEKELGCSIILTNGQNGEGLHLLIEETEKKRVVKQFKKLDKDNRQQYIRGVINKSTNKKAISKYENTKSDKIDKVVTNKYLGVPIFLGIMTIVFWLSQRGVGGYFSDYLNEIFFAETVPNYLNNLFSNLEVSKMLQGLIVEGVVGGIGAVLGFLPLIIVLFFLLALLEDSGYLARVALIMDVYLRKVGLSGKSIIPMIVGTGCSVPGVMATRTIENDNERKMTIMLTPFVPCSAKMPIIALFSVVFFPTLPFIGPLMYILSIVVIVLAGLILKKIFKYSNDSLFILELPDYKMPSLKYAIVNSLDKAKGFIYKATTIILVMNTVIWLMQAYTPKLEVALNQENSILAIVGTFIAPLLIPLGFAGWQLAAATITGFVAKEEVVATLAVVLGVTGETLLFSTTGQLTQLFNPVTGFAFLIFNLFTPPCFAAIGAMNTEFKSKKWLMRGIGFQVAVGYILAMLVTQVGTILVYKKLADGFIPSIIILIVSVGYVTFLMMKSEENNE